MFTKIRTCPVNGEERVGRIGSVNQLKILISGKDFFLCEDEPVFALRSSGRKARNL
jgi:hypothetical protein